VVRAHTASLGANALLCYSVAPEESSGGRNQVYHMLSVTGHAVLVEPAAPHADPLLKAAAADPADPRLPAIRRRRANACAALGPAPEPPLRVLGGWRPRGLSESVSGDSTPRKGVSTMRALPMCSARCAQRRAVQRA